MLVWINAQDCGCIYACRRRRPSLMQKVRALRRRFERFTLYREREKKKKSSIEFWSLW